MSSQNIGTCFGPFTLTKTLYTREGINKADNKYFRHYLYIKPSVYFASFGFSLYTNITRVIIPNRWVAAPLSIVTPPPLPLQDKMPQHFLDVLSCPINGMYRYQPSKLRLFGPRAKNNF